MFDRNNMLENYAKEFNFKKVFSSPNILTYSKLTKEGFVVIEADIDDPYVNFYLNEETKIFKKSDLLLCTLERVPAAWEVENDSSTWF